MKNYDPHQPEKILFSANFGIMMQKCNICLWHVTSETIRLSGTRNKRIRKSPFHSNAIHIVRIILD